MKLKISLDSFDTEDTEARPPNTPRSLDACKAAGVRPKDLVKRRVSDFHSAHTTAKHAQLAFQHHENLRQQWIQASMDAYYKLKNQRDDSFQPENFKDQLEKEKMERIKEIAQKEQAQIVETLVREQDHRERAQDLEKKKAEMRRIAEEKRRKHEEKIEKQRAKQKIENEKRNRVVREAFQKNLVAKMKAAREKELKSRRIIEEINEKKKLEWEKQKKDAQERSALVHKQRDEWQKMLDEEHKKFLSQLEEAQSKRAEMLEKAQHEVKEKNAEKAELNERNLQRVKKKHQLVLEEKKLKTLEKHRRHQERLDKLQAEREQREKEKAALLKQREEERLERLKRTEEETRRQKEEALKKHEEKQKKIQKIMEQKEEALKDASFELALRHKERQTDRQRHLLKEEFKRKKQVSYLENKMKKIEQMQKKREELSKVRRHATILAEESKRRMKEYLKSIKSDKITVPKWADEDKIENYMEKNGYADKYSIGKKKHIGAISPNRYDDLLGLRYYTRHMPEVDLNALSGAAAGAEGGDYLSASWDFGSSAASERRTLSPLRAKLGSTAGAGSVGRGTVRSRSVEPPRRASATSKIMRGAV